MPKKDFFSYSHPMFALWKVFWKKNPALFYGLAFYLGIMFGFGYVYSLLPACFLFLVKHSPKKTALICSIFTFASLYVLLFYQFPTAKQMEGTAQVILISKQPYKTPFHSGIVYKGVIKKFIPKETYYMNGRNIPFSMKIAKKKTTPFYSADAQYEIRGKLLKTNGGRYVFLPNNKIPWKKMRGSLSFTEMRYKVKDFLHQYILSKYSDEKVGHFLSGIGTGMFNDPFMIVEFGRFGLQHIMAISGFHFAAIALIISTLLRLFVSPQMTYRLILVFLTSYYFFLGGTASIFRAWIMASIFFGSFLLKKESRPLNSLGVALLIVLLCNPAEALSLGFTFSFLVTGSILCFYPIAKKGIQTIIPKRKLTNVIEMDALSQYGYVFLSFLRNAAALALSVQVTAFPLILYTSSRFPLMSFIYNSFFPFLITFSLFLLILGLLFFFIPPAAALIHSINNFYTKAVLGLVYNIPTSMDFWIHSPPISPLPLILYLTLLFALGFFYKSYFEKKKLEAETLAFL